MPFGAVGAVYSWDRLGSAVQAIIAVLLLSIMGRYVDDLFTAEFCQLAWSARGCVIELVHLLGLSLSLGDKSPLPAEVMVAL